MERIFVFGAGGHAKVAMDAIERQGLYKVAFLVDDAATRAGRALDDHCVLGGRAELIRMREECGIERGIVAVGDNGARNKIAGWLIANGFGLVRVVHPSATLAGGASIGAGSVVMAGAVVNTGAIIGRNAIVNTGAIVDHDCFVGDAAHIAPGATLCGSVSVGDGALVGAGAVVIQGVSIGRCAVVGAGSAVIDDVPDGFVVAGAPARAISGSACLKAGAIGKSSL